MSSDDPLLDQADALMRRHRVFVAGAHADAAEAEFAPSPDNEADAGPDDLPLLTEEVDAEPVPPAAEMEVLARDRLNQLLNEQRAALNLEMETWLDEQLPQLVILAMDGITDHLVTLITNRARRELLPRLDKVLESATSSGSSALSTETPGRVQAPTVDSGVRYPSDEAVPEDDSERPG